jgi:3-oxoadipate enol-lactonase
VPTIERAGARIHYEVQGAGPTLVLGHSLLFDGRMWADLVPGLSRRYRVINVDARAHRHSTTPGPFTLEDLADDWIAILDQEKTDRALLCGLSMGGMTAMRLALRFPDRVAAMALLDTSADEEPSRERRTYRALAEVQRAIRLDPLVTPILRKKMFAPTTRTERPEVVERGLAIIAEKEPRVLYPALRAVFDRPSIIDRISAITCPTTVICGEDDAATTPSRSQRIADRIPGATLHLIPRAGHISVMEQPVEIETRLQDFFSRHASRAA